jgi:hypothetical protein
MEQQIVMMPAMQLETNAWNSLYLKVLPVDLTVNGVDINSEETLKEVIEQQLCLGKVSRIDFTERKGTNGSIQRSAYIHFFLWNATYGADCRKMIDETGTMSYSGVVNHDGTLSPFMGKWYNGVSKKRFLSFRKNINPISSTNPEEMNKSQLLNNYNKLLEHQQKMEKRLEDFIKNERSELIAIADGFRSSRINNKDNRMTLDELSLTSNEEGEVYHRQVSPQYREAEMCN